MKIHHIIMTWVAVLATAGLTSCVHPWEDLQPQEERLGFGFEAQVVSGRGQTRANATIVNKGEKVLPASVAVTDAYGAVIGLEPAVGLFGYYTGASGWSETATPDLFYNSRLRIEAATVGGTNYLHHDADVLDTLPQRFWPNTLGDKVSFWAYYPYNASATYGTHGIDITPSLIGTGSGRGKVRFRMSADAAENVDFLVSDLVKDRTKPDLLTDDEGATYYPERVPLLFRHLLAQVRVYANLDRPNRIEYVLETDPAQDAVVVNGLRYKLAVAGDYTYDEAAGTKVLVTAEDIAAGRRLRVFDEAHSAFWSDRVSLSLSLNQIKTEATYTLQQYYDESVGGPLYPYENEEGLGSVTVSNYVENPLWFKYEAWDTGHEHPKLNEDYMYGDANYAPGNIVLAVPQRLRDEYVPTIVLTLSDQENDDPRMGKRCTARMTVNLLNMNIKWEQGFIYSYAFKDALRPGDDIVRGPENIEVVFDPTKTTDQW